LGKDEKSHFMHVSLCLDVFIIPKIACKHFLGQFKYRPVQNNIDIVNCEYVIHKELYKNCRP